MTRLRAAWAKLLDTATVALHRLLGVLRGRALHILITGPDPMGMEALATALLRSSPQLKVHSGRAAETQTCFRRVVISASLDDLTERDGVMTTVGRFRKVVVIAATSDPRDLVCARNPDLPHQWPDGFDYRFLFGPNGTKSFTEPGVLPRFAGLDQWNADTKVSVMAVTREELQTKPQAALARVGQTFPSSPGWLKKALTSVHVSLPPAMTWSASKETTKRVLQQVALAPELDERATGLGYPALESLTKARAPKITRGTIVAFHTPDEVYRAEAARLKGTLDALGLDYHFFEVEPEKNWVRTTLLKPSWILKAREELAGPLLYIDVDAYVHHDPWPLLSSCDGDLAAVVYRNGQLNSATIWINDTDGARDLIAEWNSRAANRRESDRGDLEATGDNGDQGVLKLAVLDDEASGSPKYRFQRLPVNLAYIFDRTETYCVGPVVIEQLQVSRETAQHDKRLARRRERLLQLEQGSTSSN